jgi:hypothetical protein
MVMAKANTTAMRASAPAEAQKAPHDGSSSYEKSGWTYKAALARMFKYKSRVMWLIVNEQSRWWRERDLNNKRDRGQVWLSQPVEEQFNHNNSRVCSVSANKQAKILPVNVMGFVCITEYVCTGISLQVHH